MDFFTSPSLMEKTRCQNIWSPKVPDSRPIAVGIPNDSMTLIPFSSVSDPKEPVTPPRPSANVPGSVLLNMIGKPTASTTTIHSICQKSVMMDALIPLATV